MSTQETPSLNRERSGDETLTLACVGCGKPTALQSGALDYLGKLGVVADAATICDDCTKADFDKYKRELAAEARAEYQERASVPPTMPHLERYNMAKNNGRPAQATGTIGPLFELLLSRELKTKEGTPWSGLFLWGKPGTEKTLKAANFVRHWIERGPTNEIGNPTAAVYRTEVQIFEGLRDFKHERKREIARLFTTPCLVVDDIGRISSTEWSAQEFYALVDQRYQNQNLTTVYVSNRSLEELERDETVSHIDARITRRIRETCRVFNVTKPNTKAR